MRALNASTTGLGVLGVAIVDHDDLERVRIERLREHRLEAAAQQVGPPERRDHDRQAQRLDVCGQRRGEAVLRPAAAAFRGAHEGNHGFFSTMKEPITKASSGVL